MDHPAIAALDRQLARKGEPVVVRRPNAGTSPLTYTDATVPALVRGYKPTELIGGVIQGDSLVILSPSKLTAWPLPFKVNDKVAWGGRSRNVQAANPISIGTEVVRIELQVRG